MELQLIQKTTNLKSKDPESESLSSRLRGIATAPKDFDYKEELANRYEVFYSNPNSIFGIKSWYA